jgi:hypothetical protein
MATFGNKQVTRRNISSNQYAISKGIRESAKALGVSPVHLATIISYETAGTFNPTKKGPTTQYGQHEGFIQFGKPQAKAYGANFNDPINSQLGEKGAVVKYMKAAGVKPGMGMLDMYAAVNAGRVGRYNASDANNGGAPGTVRDKVNNQMSGHARKAEQMLALTGPLSSTIGNDIGIDNSSYKRNIMGATLDYNVPDNTSNSASPNYGSNKNPAAVANNSKPKFNRLNNPTTAAMTNILSSITDLTSNQLNSSMNDSYYRPTSLFPINFGPNTEGEIGVA